VLSPRRHPNLARAEGSLDAVLDPPPRSGFVDTLRGFALFGICIANLPYLALPEYGSAGTSSGPDAVASIVVALLVDGKFFPLFSFLFGFGFAVQLGRIRDGRMTAASYARRLIGLSVLGTLHAILLYQYDILLSYALLGALLWRVRRWPDPLLLRLAGVSVALAAVCFTLLVLGGSAVEAGALTVEGSQAAIRAYLGPFVGLLEYRLRQELPLAVAATVLFNWPLAFAAFCAGLVAGRRGLLQDPRRLEAVLRPHLPLLCAGALVGNAAAAASPWLPPLPGAVTYALLAFGGPCLAALYALLIAHAWRRGGRWSGRPALAWLEPAGRMSLTNYLGQSLAANALFTGWGGLGLYGAVGRPALVAIALLIAGSLAALSRLWLRRFRAGPCEWLLRSWATLRPQPLLRRRQHPGSRLDPVSSPRSGLVADVPENQGRGAGSGGTTPG
jgi:uncharacterized protein